MFPHKIKTKNFIGVVIVFLLLYLSLTVKRQSKPKTTVNLNEQIKVTSSKTKTNNDLKNAKNKYLDTVKIENTKSSNSNTLKVRIKQNSSQDIIFLKINEHLKYIEKKERMKIRIVQELLIELDYPNVEVSGFFDVKSRKALQQFITDFNLRLKIRITPELIEQLRISRALYESTK